MHLTVGRDMERICMFLLCSSSQKAETHCEERTAGVRTRLRSGADTGGSAKIAVR